MTHSALTLALMNCLALFNMFAHAPVEKRRAYSITRDSVVITFINETWRKGAGYPTDGYGWQTMGDAFLRRGAIQKVATSEKLDDILYLKDAKNRVAQFVLQKKYGKGVRDYVDDGGKPGAPPEEWTETYVGTDGVRFMTSGFGDYPGWAYLVSNASRHKGKQVPQKIGDFTFSQGIKLGFSEREVCKVAGKPLLRKMYKGYTILAYGGRLKAKGQTRDDKPFNMVTGSVFAFKNDKLAEYWREFWDVYHP